MTIDFDDTAPRVDPPKRIRRRQVAGAVGAAMLVAAAGGVGFGIGRSLDSDDAIVSPAAEEVSAPPATEGSAQPPTTVSVEAPATSDEPASTLVPESGFEDEAARDIAASGGAGWSVFGDSVTELLFERTTDDGFTVRAHLGEVWAGEGEYFETESGWQPPGWCFESGQVRLALAGGDVIDVATVSWYAEPFKGRAVSWVTMGRVDEAPHRVVFVQTPADVSLVTATFGDGSVDAVAPQNGVAVLLVPGAPVMVEQDDGFGYTWVEEVPDFEVTFGGAAEAVVVDEAGVGAWSDPEFNASCSPPPPALPEPGEQPTDAAAAEAEIVELMLAMYGEGGLVANLDRIVDATGIEEAAQQVAEGGFQDEAASAQAIVEDLVFTDPSTAWFRYRIETSGITLDERFGIATVVDGVWKVTRDTICQDLSMAGGSCGGVVQVIRPPGPDNCLDECDHYIAPD